MHSACCPSEDMDRLNSGTGRAVSAIVETKLIITELSSIGTFQFRLLEAGTEATWHVSQPRATSTFRRSIHCNLSHVQHSQSGCHCTTSNLYIQCCWQKLLISSTAVVYCTTETSVAKFASRGNTLDQRYHLKEGLRHGCRSKQARPGRDRHSRYGLFLVTSKWFCSTISALMC